MLRAPAANLPGQFITLDFSNAGAGGATLYQPHSLCGDSRSDAPWEITVKRALSTDKARGLPGWLAIHRGRLLAVRGSGELSGQMCCWLQQPRLSALQARWVSHLHSLAAARR
jgi:hypothetical protein